MEATSSQGQVVHAGLMDHRPVSDEVIKYLEGGIKTYSVKFAKYRGEERLTIG